MAELQPYHKPGSHSEPTAIITGASRGIGAAIAERLAGTGRFRLALVSRDADALEQVIRERARQATAARAFPCDVTRPAEVKEVFGRILDWAGRVDVLVNNAGIGKFQPLVETGDADWDLTMATNLSGVFRCSRAVIPAMIGQKTGHIINISSLAGKNAFAGGGAYCASKWGLQGLTYCMAEELREHNIRASVICPGSVHTEFSPHAGKAPERMLQPDDVARAVEWLLTQEPQSFVSEIQIRPTRKP